MQLRRLLSAWAGGGGVRKCAYRPTWGGVCHARKKAGFLFWKIPSEDLHGCRVVLSRSFKSVIVVRVLCILPGNPAWGYLRTPHVRNFCIFHAARNIPRIFLAAFVPFAQSVLVWSVSVVVFPVVFVLHISLSCCRRRCFVVVGVGVLVDRVGRSVVAGAVGFALLCVNRRRRVVPLFGADDAAATAKRKSCQFLAQESVTVSLRVCGARRKPEAWSIELSLGVGAAGISPRWMLGLVSTAASHERTCSARERLWHDMTCSRTRKRIDGEKRGISFRAKGRTDVETTLIFHASPHHARKQNGESECSPTGT